MPKIGCANRKRFNNKTFKVVFDFILLVFVNGIWILFTNTNNADLRGGRTVKMNWRKKSRFYQRTVVKFASKKKFVAPQPPTPSSFWYFFYISYVGLSFLFLCLYFRSILFEDLSTKVYYTERPNTGPHYLYHSTVDVILNTCLLRFNSNKHVARKWEMRYAYTFVFVKPELIRIHLGERMSISFLFSIDYCCVGNIV